MSSAELRAYLTALNTAMLCTMAGINWPDGRNWLCLLDQLHLPTLPPVPTFTPEQLKLPFGDDVRTLAAGGEYRLRRNDLPDRHAERFAGDPNDNFVIGADDVLRRI